MKGIDPYSFLFFPYNIRRFQYVLGVASKKINYVLGVKLLCLTTH